MSRSYRHLPICGITTVRSEKNDKRIARRKWRRAMTLHLHHVCRDDSGKSIPLLREISNVWYMGKDGKIMHDSFLSTPGLNPFHVIRNRLSIMRK